MLFVVCSNWKFDVKDVNWSAGKVKFNSDSLAGIHKASFHIIFSFLRVSLRLAQCSSCTLVKLASYDASCSV